MFDAELVTKNQHEVNPYQFILNIHNDCLEAADSLVTECTISSFNDKMADGHK